MRALLLAVLLVACGGSERVLEGESVTVACGMCVFEMPEMRGCYWAVELDGEHLPVVGAPDDPDPHGPEGMCSVSRTAVVDGKVKDDRLYVTSWELVPLEVVPEEAPAHDHVH